LLCLDEDTNFRDYVKQQVGEDFDIKTASKYELSVLMFNFYVEEPSKLFKIIKKLRKGSNKKLLNNKNKKDSKSPNKTLLEKIIEDQMPEDPARKKRDLNLRRARVIFWENKRIEDDKLRNPQAEEEAKEPSLMKMAGNFASAMKSFAGSGFLRITKEQHAERMTICNGCEFWKADARFGLGKCLKCGCTGAKQWIATSVCPINKWGAISKEEVEANWEQIKQKEKGRSSITDGVPIAMPALMHADKLITRVKSVDSKIAQVAKSTQVESLAQELQKEEEVGQFLLSFVAMCNEKGIDSESALRKAISKYREEIKKSEN
jgi:hypothetical protein